MSSVDGRRIARCVLKGREAMLRTIYKQKEKLHWERGNNRSVFVETAEFRNIIIGMVIRRTALRSLRGRKVFT